MVEWLRIVPALLLALPHPPAGGAPGSWVHMCGSAEDLFLPLGQVPVRKDSGECASACHFGTCQRHGDGTAKRKRA